ncbi:putative Glutathione S-transferase family protein [Candidatus Filomicrobium marinum]|uniref:Putative Glutathione S-transferase family protein n=1 Tax=Candidatus Filomicrobium marinum TaxID=1608628 RepID=A0A0D6JFP3_9HYPH|nr:glutathione S-transferase [Candidatus Filomicrobium marinum]CFX28290.1 putative Glutathione S-transferase family protein [Candidatus Filomicrobium marinum]CPR19670.1 putative Glutathione S-transferase family protein [Candidatus Filomicrobium marinum]
MKLFYSPTSPYARKVLVVAHEKGLVDAFELVEVNPWKDPEDLLAVSPFCKVPTLATKEDGVITESTTICEYLDNISAAPSLVQPNRLEVLTRAGIAQGLKDATVASVLEVRRPVEFQWHSWLERQRNAITRALPRVPTPPSGRFDLGDIGLACALAYLDLRLKELDWRSLQPGLGPWLEEVSTRPSMLATKV